MGLEADPAHGGDSIWLVGSAFNSYYDYTSTSLRVRMLYGFIRSGEDRRWAIFEAAWKGTPRSQFRADLCPTQF